MAMPRLPASLHTPPVVALLPAIAALLLCFVPGFGVLDYHACLALSPIAGLCSGHVMMSALSRRLEPQRRAVAALALLGLPLAVFLAAMFAVPNCNIGYGLGFYLLGPCASALVGAGLGALAWLLLPGSRSRTTTLFYGLVLASAAQPLHHFYTQPQVYAFHGLFGYVAGALYEDAVALAWPYVSFRLLDVALWAPLLALAATVAHSPLPRWQALRVALQRPALRIGLAVAAAALLSSQLRAERERWRIPAAAIVNALPVHAIVHDASGAVVLRLHMPRDVRLAGDRERAVEDAAFRYASLRKWFAAAPGVIDVFFYPDAASKQRWMGAHRVDMAKPWLRQVHMVLPDLGASVLTHELAHVFAARFAPAPFGVPLRGGLVPDAVLIEGLAVAAEWPHADGLDPHQWSRAMREVGLAPPLQTLFSTSGFFGQSSERAYTLAGSFLRWLLETRGMAVVARLYATADVQEATGQSLEVLVPQWQAFLGDDVRHPLTPGDLDRARARFERPGLFARPCALEAGRCVERAYDLWRTGRDRQAVGVWQSLVDRLRTAVHGALDPEWTVGWAEALSRVGSPRAATKLLNDLLSERHDLNRLQRARLLIVRGDLALQAGDVAGAERDWRTAMQSPIGQAAQRTLEVKRHLAALPDARPFVKALLAAGAPFSEPEPVLEALRAAVPGDPFARYLWARHAVLHADGDAGLRELKRLTPLFSGPLARECERLVALHLARRGQCGGLDAWLVGRTRPAQADDLRARCAFSQNPAGG